MRVLHTSAQAGDATGGEQPQRLDGAAFGADTALGVVCAAATTAYTHVLLRYYYGTGSASSTVDFALQLGGRCGWYGGCVMQGRSSSYPHGFRV